LFRQTISEHNKSQLNACSGNNIRYYVAVCEPAGRGGTGLRKVNLQQLIKWSVYSLLLVNWALYVLEEWHNAQFTLANGGSLLDWTEAFGTSLDETAWFGLLFLWELETYVLSDESWNRVMQWAFLGIRGGLLRFPGTHGIRLDHHFF
jgi:hypothetical protein